MSSVYSMICNTLELLGYPVREQGTYPAGASLPATLVTYQIIGQDNETHADNQPTSTTTSVQVALYSQDPAIVQTADQSLKAVLLPAGFTRAGGRSLPFDADTGRYGYVSTYNLYEMEG